MTIKSIEPLTLAQQYATHEWTPTEASVTHELYSKFGINCKFTSGIKIIGFAYAWGGFDTINNFDQRISNGAAAGLCTGKYIVRDSEGNPLIDSKGNPVKAVIPSEWYSKAAGIDCSGFVSRLWGISWHANTTELTRYSYRIPIWDAQINDAWNKPVSDGSHIMWISSSTISGDEAKFSGYHASGAGTVRKFKNLADKYFKNNSYKLFRKGNDNTPPKLEKYQSESIISIKNNNKKLKFTISDDYCGEAVVKIAIPQLTEKLIKDARKIYTFLEIPSNMSEYCDGSHEFVVKFRDLNPTKIVGGKVVYPDDSNL